MDPAELEERRERAHEQTLVSKRERKRQKVLGGGEDELWSMENSQLCQEGGEFMALPAGRSLKIKILGGV